MKLLKEVPPEGIPVLTKKQRKRINAVESAVCNIALTSTTVLSGLANNVYRRHNPTSQYPFWYTELSLSPSEVSFYEKCQTKSGVLEFHHEKIVETLRESPEFELFPIRTFSEEQRKGKQYIVVF